MTNKRTVKCCGCGARLEPGQGERWTGRLPHWARKGGYVCEGCASLWGAWDLLAETTQLDMERAARVIEAAPAEGVEALQGGRITVMDCRAVAQGELRAICLGGTGLMAAAVARYTADYLEQSSNGGRVLEADECIEIAYHVRNVVTHRIGRIVRL